MKYMAGIRDMLRKQNTAKLRGSKEVVEPDAMGADAELGDDDLAAIMSSDEGDIGSMENEMGDAEEVDQEQMGDAPQTPDFKKKRPILTKG